MPCFISSNMGRPFVVISPLKLPKYLEQSVIEQMIDKANHDNGKHGRRNHLVLITLYQTGMRVSEVSNLHKKDIKDDMILIRGGKGGRDRIIPVKTELRNLLLVYSD